MNTKEVYEIAQANNLFSYSKSILTIKSVFTKSVLSGLSQKTKQDEIVHFVQEVFEKKLKRKQRNCYVENIKSLKDQFTESRRQKLQKRFKDVFNWNYRSPDSAWVDQNHSYTVDFSKDRSYSLDVQVNKIRHEKHWNWTANELSAVLSVPSTTKLSQIKDIGNMLTVFKSKYSCIWFSQGKGFTLKNHEGWCINDTHIEKSETINTLSDAIRYYKDVKKKQLKKQLATEKKLNAIVTIEHSVKAGNCYSGSLSFKNRYFPDRDAVTVKEVLQKEDSVFTRRLLSVV